MSNIVGVDFGNAHLVVAQVRSRGVDVLLNGSSKRLNPSAAAFNGKERIMLESAAVQATSNYKNTVMQVKRLIGRKFSDPVVQADIADSHVVKVVPLDGDEIGVEVTYDDKPTVFTPQQILSMQLGAMSNIVASSNAGAGIKDVVLSVPPYFTQKMRGAVVDAARIAGMTVLRLLNENTASALSYGIFRGARGEFPEGGATVLFMDAGQNCFTATVVEFTNESLKVKGVAYDTAAGGRDIDIALAKHFAGEFGAKVGADVWTMPKARLKLLKAAEKAKKTLSPHGVNQAGISEEYLAMEQDYQTKLTVDQFDTLAADVGQRIGACVTSAMAQAGITAGSDFAAIELVGGASRPRIVKRAIATALGLELNEATGHGLLSTQNPDECVARGCALACAQLAPGIRVKPFAVTDRVEYPVRISWGGAADADGDADLADGAAAAGGEKLLIKRGEAWPIARRRITFKQFGDFTVHAEYAMDEAEGAALPEGQPIVLGDYAITGVAKKAGEEEEEPPKIRVDFALDASGMFTVLRAEMRQTVVETPAPEAAAPADAAAPAPAADVEGKAAEGEAPAPAGDGEGKEETPAADATTPPTDGAATPAAEAAAPPAATKKVRCTELKLAATGTSDGLPLAQLTEAAAAERRMQDVDALIEATQAKRNELETYVYDTRGALGDRLEPFVAPEAKDTFAAALDQMENWLYEDGFDADVDTYAAKLAELTAVGGPIKRRLVEFEAREPAVAGLLSAVGDYRAFIQTTTDDNEHLTDTDRDVVRAACNRAEDWVRDGQAKQAGLKTYEDPVLTLSDIQGRLLSLRGECDPIKNKPKPAPPAPEPAPAAEEGATPAASAEGAAPAAEGGEASTATEGEAPAAEGAETAPADTPADADGDVKIE